MRPTLPYLGLLPSWPDLFIRRLAPTILIGVSLCAGTAADTLAQSISFDNDVLPILQTHCLDCHSQDTAEAALRLDSEKMALRGGDSGEPAIVPGDLERSYLIQRLTTENAAQRMPPDSDPLPDHELEILKRWVQETEHWKSLQESEEDSDLDHWAFQPVQRPAIPADQHPIDFLIDRKLASEGLHRSPLAPARTRMRRLGLVVHGLAPTEEQIRSLEDQDSESHWNTIVDQALQSPRFGERMAAYWLDLVRFGETTGFETNRERPHAWRYRDWVIQSMNDDLPYDQFIKQQLAGDLLEADVATGFLVGGPYDLVKGQDPLLGLMQRQDELADMINTTGTAFLGLTLGCARCHNHKFDPVTQADYFSLQAVFAGVQHGDRPLPLAEDQQERLQQLDAQIAEHWQRLQPFFRPAVDYARNEETFEPVTAGYVRMILNQSTGAEPCIDEWEVFSGQENIALASRGTIATSNGDFVHPLHQLEHINDGQYGNPRSWISAHATGGWIQLQFEQPFLIDRIVWGRDREGKFQDRLATDYQFQISDDGQNWTTIVTSRDRLPLGSSSNAPSFDFSKFPAEQAAEGQENLDALRQLLKERSDIGEPAQAYAGNFQQPGPTYRLYRGDPAAPREAVPPRGIASLSDWQLPESSAENQRRLALANWIASPDNPLTARVIVNRIWQYHFGTGLVDTASDFGANGTRPSHPELLDWLASQLVEHQWSLKHIHRLILTSATWQQDHRPHPEGMRKDANSRWLWRYPSRRLEAECIRDNMLQATGHLDLTEGGPGFSAFQIEEENVRHYHPKESFGPEDWRRMIYMTRVRQERDAVFGVFDCPDFNQVVPKRSQSTTPLQALNLFNSRFVMQQADLLVQRLSREAATDSEKVQRAYQLCFSRSPQPDEVQAALQFVQESGWDSFARALLNANEFVFIP